MSDAPMSTLRPNPSDRLDSWKEIAAYLKRGVRTVQRWEQTRSLPVHRLEHDRRASVYAYRAELDAWWERRSRQVEASDSTEVVVLDPRPASSKRRSRVCALAVMVCAILLLGFTYLGRRRTRTESASQPLEPVLLTSDPGAEDWPAFSPDGNQVAYSWSRPPAGNSDIYVRKVGSTSAAQFTESPEPDIAPAWSPDGVQIAFLRVFPKSGAKLILKPALGGAEKVIADVGPDASGLSWSPGGNWIVSSESRDSPPSLVAIKVDTGQRRRLTAPPSDSAGDNDPAVAPDGSNVIFIRERDGTRELYRLPVSSEFKPAGEPERLTKEGNWPRAPAFLADGRAVLYMADLFEQADLWLLPLSPSPGRPRVLLTGQDRFKTLAVSPKHSRLALSAERHDEISSVWTLHLTADLRPEGEAARLPGSERGDCNARYSPDGGRIVFQSTRTGASEIWVRDPRAENAVCLTRLNARGTGNPQWSPDGKWIAFESDAGGRFEIYRIPSTGGNPERLTDSAAINRAPTWSRDGRSIYFASNRSGSDQIWKMSAAGANPRQLTQKGGCTGFESHDGRWVYYGTRPGIGPLCRVPAEGGEEMLVLAAAHEHNFCLTRDGVLFARSPRLLEFLETTTGRIVPLLRLKHALVRGVAISPDQRHLLVSQADNSGHESNLMLVENFHPMQ